MNRVILASLVAAAFIPFIASAEDTAPVASIYCPNLTVTLSFGTNDARTGGQVTELQRFLTDYYDLNPADYVTGYFGRLTRQNVQRFQCETMGICSGDESTTGWGVAGVRTRATIATKCGVHTSIPTPPQNLSCSFNGRTIEHNQSVTAYRTSSVAAGGECAFETRTCQNGVLSGSYQYANCSIQTAATYRSCAFGGQTIAHTASTTAYKAASVAAGQVCQSETRICSDGMLSGSYSYQACTVEAAATGSSSNSCVYQGRTYASGVVLEYCMNGLKNTAGGEQCDPMVTYTVVLPTYHCEAGTWIRYQGSAPAGPATI